MEIEAFILLTAAVINLIFGFFVLFRKGSWLSRVSYFSLAFFVALWILTRFFVEILPITNTFFTPLILSLYLSAGLIMNSFFSFTLVFLNEHYRTKHLITKLITVSLINLFIIILVLTKKVVQDFFLEDGLLKIVFHKSGYTLYSVYIISYFVIPLYFLCRKYVTAKGVLKNQIKFVIIGAFLSGITAMLASLILPYLGNFTYLWLGPVLPLFMVTFIAYAIFKHHLFNIKVISIELFSALISIFVLIDALLAKTLTEFVLKFGVFIGVAIISILIIRAVLNEIKAKEQIAKISQDLRLANVELKRLDRTKSEFLSIASHQLRTPLTAIKGYSSMILEGEFGELNTKPKEVINRIFQSSQRLVLMIEDFLNVSRIELGKMKYDFTNFDLKEIIKNIIEDFKTNNPRAEKLNLQFIAGKENFKIDGDQNKIRQVVSNVIDNAIKYTEKGFVKVFLEHTDTNSVRIKIQDSGAGIRKEDLSRVFQKFTRASGGEKTHSEGSGLGLYVAGIITENHNGKIWAESEGLGKGTVFFIELPSS